MDQITRPDERQRVQFLRDARELHTAQRPRTSQLGHQAVEAPSGTDTLHKVLNPETLDQG